MKSASNKFLQVYAALFVASVLVACSGTPLLPNGSEHNFPFAAQVSVVHHPTADANGDYPDYVVAEGRAFETDMEYFVTLEHATLSWKELLLISGGDDPECEPGHDRVMDLDGTEDMLGEDLLTSSFGFFEIEERPYCEYELTLGPITSPQQAILLADHTADGDGHDDADGGTGNFTDAGTDLTLDLGGTWSQGSESGEFEVHSVEELIAMGVFKAKVNGEAVEHPIHLHDGETELEILFGIKYDQLLDGIDFVLDSETDIEEAVLDNIVLAIHQHLGETHN